MCSSSGTIATTALTRGMGRPSARPTSRIAARAQRAERADLGHVLAAIFLLDVLDHLAAALLIEVDVDIGRLLRFSSRNRSNTGRTGGGKRG